MKLGIGIDLGGTNIKAMALDLELGDEIARADAPTRDGEFIDGKPAFAVEAQQLLARLESKVGETATVVGLSAPGLADKAHTCIRFMPGRIAGIENLVWSEHFGREHVAVLNDAHAALMGEIWQGAARGVDDGFMLTLGTGVGGAIVAGGRLITGHIGRAGHLGHISLNPDGPLDIANTPGSMEDKIGNCTIQERTGGRFTTTHALVEAAQNGDSQAQQWWGDVIKSLAAGLAGLIDVLDPEMIVIGGGISKAGPMLFDPLAELLDRFEWRPNNHQVKIRPAKLGEWAGSYGSVYFAQQQTQNS